ncbi:enterochelin esterase-like enzyme [Terriglobus roseus DSM 18391]|uniref:Enterochelin esterase-like enzyme n=1 Tax=Terriglobus roseus (strain DSM 18391 / NRRL B-41598 / KBS 63) TaxID=926566 RepID=I3ZCR9_TERRK|nr:alpha/beta hydrolase-fold protein [Terriglobus roseus]AFL87037.1 enterochelin esterase-like enzyme [Terriglobus roseus DSM 18391]
MRRLLLSLLFLTIASAKAQYQPGPDSQVQNVPHGIVEKLVLAPGKFYPGTPHNYAIYLPANAPATPLPYMIFLDGTSYLGNNLRAANVLDNLIAAKQIPPMAAIFVDPGILPAIRPDAQNRYERIFEYDSLSARYVNFLEEELIPAVAKKHTLSTNPDEHAIGGTSTGAVGAFVAAWHRPDQFHRVLSLIGTYVAMKGADTLPELVRKTEARPIRIWMQDGANDHITPDQPYGTFYAGTWPRANQLLFDALQFQGYDAKLTIGTGGHDTKQGGAELPEALRWLWRDYTPEHGIGKIEPHPPAALGKAGWDTRGSVWATVDAIGNWEPAKEKVLEARAITAANIHYLADGHGHILWSSTLKPGQEGQVASPALKADAVALSPDQAMLIVTDPEHRHQWSMQLQADGTPANAEPFYRLEVLDDDGGAKGAAVDALGQVYFATAVGIQVCEASGRVAMILNSPVPDKTVDAVAFGGPDREWLYAVADGKLFRRKMKVHAAPIDKPEKPPQPPL